MPTLLIVLTILIGTILAFVIGVFAYIQLNPQFGAKISEADIQRFAKSKQWNGSKFKNRLEPNMQMNFGNILKMLRNSYVNRKIRSPKSPLPIIPFDKEAFLSGSDSKFIWYGHSVVLLRMAGKSILIDPMLSDDTTPIAPMKNKRFSDNTLALIDQFPTIDIVCLSHDHYDHLDYASIKKLKEKSKHFVVALGLGRHLKKWGIPESKITEMDWWDEIEIDGIKLIYTETRHFSGRGLNDRFKSLWGGWILNAAGNKVYWSGDSGEGPHFDEIGAKYGPFDIGFMECGQYNELWADIHMTPEQSVEAAKQANVKLAIPVHCMGFALAMHHWQEPINRFKAAAKAQNQPTIFPELGELISIPKA